MRIFVRNLNYRSTEDELRELFETHGEVEEAVIISDRETGRSKGYAFVTMPNDAEAQAAIEALDGSTLDDRPLGVDKARPRGEGARP